MREVTEFVVVFPARLVMQAASRKEALLSALSREYPHYTFQAMEGTAFSDDEEFGIIPIVGRAGDHPEDDPDRIYMCKPLDPRVVPDLVRKLRAFEAGGVAVH